MRNIEISLTNNCDSDGSRLFRMIFSFQEKDVVYISTTDSKDKSQHDFSLTKEDYLFLREQLNAHFEEEEE